jgi:Mn-dependent DtxR family transcriptional regulator
MAKDKREFTGVFIPACVWESKELTPAEKMMLGEIIALSESRGYCSAGRQHFADWLDCTLPNISYMYKTLKSTGYFQTTEPFTAHLQSGAKWAK